MPGDAAGCSAAADELVGEVRIDLEDRIELRLGDVSPVFAKLPHPLFHGAEHKARLVAHTFGRLVAEPNDALAVRAAGTASLSPELLTRLTQALRRPPPPDPLHPLSPREREVLRLIACGHSNRQIARDLGIGEQTVKTHVRSILTKLGLQDRVQAAIFAVRHQAGS